MKHTSALLTVVLLGTGIMSAQDTDLAGNPASDLQKKGYALNFARTDSLDKAILKETKPQGPHEIPVPNFVVKSDNNKFLMTIGGQINTIVGWDFGNNLYKQADAGGGFMTQAIPVPATQFHKKDFFINPFNAALDFQVVGLAGTPNQITGYVKIATNGYNNSLTLSKAYLNWKGITAGLKSTLLQDGNACQPPTIDPEGPSGVVGATVYEIGYTSKNYNGFQFAVGADLPSFYSSNGIYRGHDYPLFDGKQVASYADAEQMVPDFPMWIQYGKSANNRVRLSGIVRNFAYRDLVAGKTEHKVGWGVMLSGNLQPCKPVVFYYQAMYGQGIGNYIQDLAGMPLSFIPKDSDPGRMSSSPMMGIDLGFSFNVTDKLQFNIMGSEARIWDVGNYATQSDSSNYKYALYGAANVFYNVTPYLQVGLEYLYGLRQTWNMGSGHDNRLQAQVMFTL